MNDDDAYSDTELANVPEQQASELRMASIIDGTMSAEEYGAPAEMRPYQGALRAAGEAERAGASDNWAQKGLSAQELFYNERRAIERAKSRAAYEAAEKVMAARAEARGADSSANMEYMLLG